MSRFSLALMGIVVMQSISMGVARRAGGNTINHSGNGGGVIVNSAYDTFSSNTFSTNRQRSGASGSCDALNVRTDYSKLQYFPNIIANDASFNNNEPACSDD